MEEQGKEEEKEEQKREGRLVNKRSKESGEMGGNWKNMRRKERGEERWRGGEKRGGKKKEGVAGGKSDNERLNPRRESYKIRERGKGGGERRSRGKGCDRGRRRDGEITWRTRGKAVVTLPNAISKPIC